MKKEIKRTPFTFHGVDGFKVLYEDPEICIGDTCQYCMFKDWSNISGITPWCDIVHGCGIGQSTYFQFIK